MKNLEFDVTKLEMTPHTDDEVLITVTANPTEVLNNFNPSEIVEHYADRKNLYETLKEFETTDNEGENLIDVRIETLKKLVDDLKKQTDFDNSNTCIYNEAYNNALIQSYTSQIKWLQNFKEKI